MDKVMKNNYPLKRNMDNKKKYLQMEKKVKWQ